MKHKHKVKLAKKLMTTQERKEGVSLWDTIGWNRRQEAKRIKELEKKHGKDWKDYVPQLFPYYVKAKGYPAKIEFLPKQKDEV